MERPPWKDPLVYLPPLLWALNLVASRAAMREMPPEWGSFLRFALALPFFLLFLRRLPRLFPLGETLFLALFGVALFNLVFFSGMRLAPASDASAVAAVYPLSTAFAYSLYGGLGFPALPGHGPALGRGRETHKNRDLTGPGAAGPPGRTPLRGKRPLTKSGPKPIPLAHGHRIHGLSRELWAPPVTPEAAVGVGPYTPYTHIP